MASCAMPLGCGAQTAPEHAMGTPTAFVTTTASAWTVCLAMGRASATQDTAETAVSLAAPGPHDRATIMDSAILPNPAAPATAVTPVSLVKSHALSTTAVLFVLAREFVAMAHWAMGDVVAPSAMLERIVHWNAPVACRRRAISTGHANKMPHASALGIGWVPPAITAQAAIVEPHAVSCASTGSPTAQRALASSTGLARAAPFPAQALSHRTAPIMTA